MSLLIMLLVVAGLGYMLARSTTGERLEDAAGQVVERTRALGDQASGQIQRRMGRMRPIAMQAWVATAVDIPEDFKHWVSNLNKSDAESFSHALQSHTRTMGLDLMQLVNGELDHQPELRKVYVEAVSVYSQAYRKAREAQQDGKTKTASKEDGDPAPVVEEKTPAEKSVSRRRQNPESLNTGEAPAV